MKQLLVRKGEVAVTEVASPALGPREVMVQVRHSCVSIGTEISGIQMSALPLWKRAIKQPHHAKKVVGMMRDQGIKRVFDRVTGMLNAGTPTGYSAAGDIVAIGDLVECFSIGDRVACAGAGIANHAEYLAVPVNLAAKIPDGLDTAEASTVTLGAIAMQGVRRADATLGETWVVVGLGILGQISEQLLRANGCRVIGTDIDPRRIAVAQEMGMHAGIDPSTEDVAKRVQILSNGFGADGVIITAAASENHDIIAQAMQCCRKRGKVVIVGDVGLNLKRHEFYAKELDVLISCSYGPGRYDPGYEQEGQDYPLPYVRWTENRNMEEYLRLMADGRINLDRLQPTTFQLEEAPAAYETLKGDGEKPMLVLLEYPQADPETRTRTIQVGTCKPHRDGQLRTAVIGAGGFAQGMHLPNLLKLNKQFSLNTICSRTGTSSLAAAKQFGIATATTDYAEVLANPDIDLVILCTRHDLHADMAIAALRAGKHVLCEKPLSLTDEGLDAIEAFYADDGGSKPALMVGFNRRWSPAITRLRELLAGRTSPIIAHYTMNAGYIPLDHWVHGPEGGGRNVGEGCHLYDLFFALAGAELAEVQAEAVAPQGKQWARNDNFTATLRFKDGSVFTLLYTAMGDKSYPKERMELFCEGSVYVLDDYKSLKVHGSTSSGWSSMTMAKGQLEELVALHAAIEQGRQVVPVEETIAISRATLEVEALLVNRHDTP